MDSYFFRYVVSQQLCIVLKVDDCVCAALFVIQLDSVINSLQSVHNAEASSIEFRYVIPLSETN